MSEITQEWLESVGFEKHGESSYHLLGLCVGLSDLGGCPLVMHEYEILPGVFTRERLCALWFGLTGEELDAKNPI